MTTRIIFNGQEYASVEAMPEEVRQAYQLALAQFSDADQNGIPDILEPGGNGNVITIQHSSITVNGGTYDGVGEMPAAVRRIYEQALLNLPHESERRTADPGQLVATLDTVLRLLLAVVAAIVLVGAVLIMLTMDAGSRNQGGRWYVAVAALVVLGAIDSQFAWLVRRREPIRLTESPGSRRYRIISFLLVLASAVALLGLALLLP